MVETNRKRIGILINNDDVGVIYYLLNLAKSLNDLPFESKPELILLFSTNTVKHTSLFEFYNNKEIHVLKENLLFEIYIKDIFKSSGYFERLSEVFQLDGIFPVLDIPFKSRRLGMTLVSWVTDFQHKIYPENFSFLNRFLREFRFQKVLKNVHTIVLSSKDSERNLNQFYKNYRAKIEVLNFVSLAQTDLVDLKPVLVKYNITKPFFLISNQFYKHKNHLVVFEAIQMLKAHGNEEFDFVFTGKTEDYRNPKYYIKLMEKVNDMGIADSFKILGLIPRNEQLLLMQNAVAVIQPSKFEGWNTSIEDAKNYGQVIICSNIDVHVEQLKEFGYYFDPNSAADLVKSIEVFMKHKNQGALLKYPNDISIRKSNFSTGFMNLFE